jgi:hypothetical protein
MAGQAAESTRGDVAAQLTRFFAAASFSAFSLSSFSPIVNSRVSLTLQRYSSKIIGGDGEVLQALRIGVVGHMDQSEHVGGDGEGEAD